MRQRGQPTSIDCFSLFFNSLVALPATGILSFSINIRTMPLLFTQYAFGQQPGGYSKSSSAVRPTRTHSGRATRENGLRHYVHRPGHICSCSGQEVKDKQSVGSTNSASTHGYPVVGAPVSIGYWPPLQASSPSNVAGMLGSRSVSITSHGFPGQASPPPTPQQPPQIAGKHGVTSETVNGSVNRDHELQKEIDLSKLHALGPKINQLFDFG
ncbi:unnamed protein product [Protopolystoma xenopodis]|uniref:Uncharacterized protein n=1 Tax=Protopolystoma xenopodis TaxID=117903 RepID=A0A3S5ALC1_9PLAT|nr:unnamed protein product [Protopolystoma xenopodis]